MVPSFGICVILSYFLYGTPLFWVLVGLYAMRTFLYLPTYKNETDFYASNFLNFRKSEVALGNLGVAFINQGMTGTAVDTWMLATKLNPHYDVPWYNLYSVFKRSGRLQEARDFLKKCLEAKVVHFEQRWKDELTQLEAQLSIQQNPVKPTELFYHEAADHFKNGKVDLELQALKKFMAGDTAGIIPEMITQVKARILEIEGNNNLQLHNTVSQPARPETLGASPINTSSGLSATAN
jgi:tetratricopeptide (TPR) repeat protein